MSVTLENITPSTSSLPQPNGSQEVSDIQEKYNQERDKRIRPDGTSQFVDLYALDKFRHFKADPWVESDAHSSGPIRPKDGEHCEILIIGGGWSGLVFAVRLLQAGFKLEDIRIVDYAGGFGGTWYWNRYPGLHCDVESYIYMPLLEETGYVPTWKYASGNELRQHAKRIATKWNLDRIAWFQQRVTTITWNDDGKEWATSLIPQLEKGVEGTAVAVNSRFVVLATGLIFIPHIPRVSGIETFKGPCFHTARWDYNTTGGTPENPHLVKLKDKRVGVVGTGATAVQVVPSLAPWCKELYVFQRTPSAVDRRDNKPTDPEFARAIGLQTGWQKERTKNFHQYLTNSPNKPSIDMVNDGWTRMTSYSAMMGTPGLRCETPDEIQKHLENLHAIDLPRQTRLRKRVDELVTDPNIAEKLKPWYPGWCKRPCFHDDYLQTFNQPHVKLVDTNGLGIKEMTEDGVVVDDKEYKIDILILSTGYRSLMASPASRTNIEINGRNGQSFDRKWNNGVTTLHGMMSHGFPNLFWPGLIQAGGSANFTACVELFAEHIISIMSHAAKSHSDNGEIKHNSDGKYRLHFTIEPTADGEEQWSQLVASQAGFFSGTAGCTPNYYNAEGHLAKITSPEELQKLARMSLWAQGPDHFAEVIADWRASKEFRGLQILSTI